MRMKQIANPKSGNNNGMTGKAMIVAPLYANGLFAAYGKM